MYTRTCYEYDTELGSVLTAINHLQHYYLKWIIREVDRQVVNHSDTEIYTYSKRHKLTER